MTNDVIEIKDLSLASYLYSSQAVKFVGKRRLSNNEVVFQFSPKDEAERLINLYWNLQAPPIQPKQLFSALRDMKDMLFGG